MKHVSKKFRVLDKTILRRINLLSTTQHVIECKQLTLKPYCKLEEESEFPIKI